MGAFDEVRDDEHVADALAAVGPQVARAWERVTAACTVGR
jgi:hypothetical protein